MQCIQIGVHSAHDKRGLHFDHEDLGDLILTLTLQGSAIIEIERTPAELPAVESEQLDNWKWLQTSGCFYSIEGDCRWLVRHAAEALQEGRLSMTCRFDYLRSPVSRRSRSPRLLPSPPPSPPCEGFQDGSGLSGFGNSPTAWERAVAKQSIECQRELALARINGMADLYEAVLSTLPPEECASLAHRAALLGTQVEALALEASVDTVSADTKGATLMPH